MPCQRTTSVLPVRCKPVQLACVHRHLVERTAGERGESHELTRFTYHRADRRTRLFVFARRRPTGSSGSRTRVGPGATGACSGARTSGTTRTCRGARTSISSRPLDEHSIIKRVKRINEYCAGCKQPFLSGRATRGRTRAGGAACATSTPSRPSRFAAPFNDDAILRSDAVRLWTILQRHCGRAIVR